jgi:L-threonylcarbamoyladenylate synthase
LKSESEDFDMPRQRETQKAVEILREGGVVAFPTDTVYGLGARADVDGAVSRIYEIKKRSRHLPLPLLLANISQLELVAQTVPELAYRLAERFFPGGLTLVLPRSSWISDIITGGGETVAVRVPNHPIPLALIRGVGVPITGTSANLSGMPGPLTAEEVCSQIGREIDFIIDGGRCPGGVESTVVDVSDGFPRVLREGPISREEIERTCKVVSNAYRRWM